MKSLSRDIVAHSQGHIYHIPFSEQILVPSWKMVWCWVNHLADVGSHVLVVSLH
jgi:hypothetical protein